jgi:hypothetical protein
MAPTLSPDDTIALHQLLARYGHLLRHGLAAVVRSDEESAHPAAHTLKRRPGRRRLR